jgi:DNA-binding CsgD family transcriptional regulator
VAAGLEAAREAMAAGDWVRARSLFEGDDSPEALAGLGDALTWLGDNDAAVRCYERAYAAFRRRPDPAQAATAAIALYFTHCVSLGNVAASRGWLARLARLVEEHELVPLEGWVLLLRSHDCGDVEAAERLAREAQDAARRAHDPDLELCALSQAGAVLVQAGRAEEGIALLDEALAGSLAGEGTSLDTVVLTSCNMIRSCSSAAEYGRAAEWVRVAGDFTGRYGSPHLYTVCRLHYGRVLLATGRWAEAEAELRTAIEAARAGERALHADAVAALAELRLAQGRVDEAGRLLAGYEDHPAAALPLASVHVARGEWVAAARIARRGLEAAGGDRLARAPLIELLAESGAAGAVDLARPLLAGPCELLVAHGERALGRALEEPARFERALAAFARLGMPLEAGRARLLLAEALRDAEPEAAIAEARIAHDAFEALGAARDADAAGALLRSLGVHAARSGPRAAGLLTKREREVLALLGEGLSNRAIAERLFLSPKTVEHHVRSVLRKLDLKSRAEAAAYAVRHADSAAN